MNAACSHLGHVQMTSPEDPVAGCGDCLQIGARWVHLRMCLECGHIGCCDSSPNRHASAHFHATAHPLVRCVEPGERWWWCYVDEVVLQPRTDA